ELVRAERMGKRRTLEAIRDVLRRVAVRRDERCGHGEGEEPTDDDEPEEPDGPARDLAQDRERGAQALDEAAPRWSRGDGDRHAPTPAPAPCAFAGRGTGRTGRRAGSRARRARRRRAPRRGRSDSSWSRWRRRSGSRARGA